MPRYVRGRGEKYYVGKLRAALVEMGAKVIKHHGGAYSQAGEPDLIACLAGRCVVIEVKRVGGVLTGLQKLRLAEWERSGAAAFVSVGEEWQDVVASVVRLCGE